MDQYSRVFDKKTASLCHLLEQGEKLHALDHKPDEKLFSSILGRARRELDELEEYVYQTGGSTSMEGVLDSLERRLARLFFLPTEDVMAYAQNLLCFSNLCLADGAWIFDSHHMPVGLSDFAVIDCTEHVLFHYPLNQDLAQASQVWQELHTVLRGKYVLCYDLIIAQAQLRVTAEQQGLVVPILVGGHFADMLVACSDNSRLFAPAHLPGLLLRVPHPDAAWLFSAEQTVLERALTMLHAFQSIAQGQRI